MPQANGRPRPRSKPPLDWPELCLPRSKKTRKPKHKKRFHHAFRLFIALGLVPSKSRQGDPLALRLNRMHVMDGDCEKSAECLAAEGAPELGIKDKHNGESGTPECPKSILEESKRMTASEKVSVNGDHAQGELETKKDVPDIRSDNNKEVEDEIEEMVEDEPPVEQNSCPEKKAEHSQESDVEVELPEEEKMECKVEQSDSVLGKVNSNEPNANKNENSMSGKEAESTNQEVKEEAAVASEEEDRNSVSSSHLSQNESERRKRCEERDGEGEVSSGSENETSRKRPKREPDTVTPEPSQESQGAIEDERERVIRDFVEGCSQNMDEIACSVEKLQKDLVALTELAKTKELEWNSILRLRKFKEEMLERLLRKRRQALIFNEGNSSDWSTDTFSQRNAKCHGGNNQLMMVPIVSSSPGGGGIGSSRGMNSVPPVRIPEIGRQQRPILPKPYPHMLDPINVIREGRNGPILDVKSIIADYSSHYRSRHPENVPRRGRRVRGEVPVVSRVSSSPALISMANMAHGSGSSVRTDPTYSMSQDHHMRTASTDPSRTSLQSEVNNAGVSFKDVLVQFAKLSQAPPSGKPPPPYPEVTLHPVSSPQSPPTSHSSLLHGILTKSSPTAGPPHRPATFSPTLARLLTAPERPSPSHQVTPAQMPPQFRPPTSRVSITDILTSSKKSRNEITITPVAGNPGTKSKDEVVLLDDDDETGSGDRLVIDEGGAEGAGGSDDVPQCQGCRQKSAQFVCAGCGNQWYCSRECQVTAWEEHSDVCSG